MATSTTIKQTHVIDQNGEIIDGKTEVEVAATAVTPEPAYVKLYVTQWLATMSGQPSLMADVLVGLIELGMTFAEDGQVIHATKYEKEAIAKRLGVNPRSIDNTIQKLVKAEALKRVERGTYAVNPRLLGKGSWKNIQSLQVSWEFDEGGIRNETYITNSAQVAVAL